MKGNKKPVITEYTESLDLLGLLLKIDEENINLEDVSKDKNEAKEITK